MEKRYNLKSNFDGYNFEVLVYECENPKGILQMCHGMAEIKDRYLKTMEKLSKAGYICVMHDHRGHGDIDLNDLGFMNDETCQGIILDAIQVTSDIKERYPHLPITLFGHSMGSLVVRNMMKTNDDAYAGLIVCGSPSKNPLVGIALLLTKVIKAIKGERHRSSLIQQLSIGSYKIKGEEYDHAWITTDKQIQKLYDESETCGFTFTCNGFINLFTLMRDTYVNKGWQVKNKDCPIFFVAGSEDPCIVNVSEFNHAIDFMKSVGYTNVSSKLYEGARHEILNDICKEEVIEDIIKFMED